MADILATVGGLAINPDNDKALRLIAWARKSLYLELGIFVFVARFDQPFTIGYFGAIIIFVWIGLYLDKGFAEYYHTRENEPDVHSNEQSRPSDEQ